MVAATLGFSSKVRVRREEVVELARRVLERELDVVEPGVLQRLRARSVRPTPEVRG